uniref:Aspartylglucosaminidase n=1 Tax=Nothobranchius rachovii TaxID=451742 RepID=A0A1A8QUX8_9TELE
MGFVAEDLTTNRSLNIFSQWLKGNCQPNYRKNVTPDPSKSCGPYRPEAIQAQNKRERPVNIHSHDTIVELETLLLSVQGPMQTVRLVLLQQQAMETS